MNESKQWYAVYTKPRWEKKVAELLVKKQIETYCPLNKIRKQWSDRKKIVFEPLFPSYVFVNIANPDIPHVKRSEGIINFVYWLGKPAVIRDVEIDIIKRFLNEHTDVHLEKTIVNINDIVRVTNGPFMELEGNVLEVRNKTVKVYLPSLGYQMVAELERTHIQVIKESYKIV